MLVPKNSVQFEGLYYSSGFPNWPVGFLLLRYSVLCTVESLSPVLTVFKVPVHPGLMIRDEPCHNRGGTVDNLGDPGGTVLNRLMSPVVLKCLKQPGLTGSNREGCQIP